MSSTSDSSSLSLFKTRLFTILMIITASLAGYLLAPADLQNGVYHSEIEVQIDGRKIKLALPIRVGQADSEPALVQTTSHGYTVEVEGPTGIANALGSKISYRVRVLDKDREPVDLAIENLTSTLHGTDYQQILPPSDQSGEWLLFSMRIPYKTKVATALMLAVAALWLTEIIPLAAAAFLVPVVVVVARISSAKAVLAPFAHPIIFLFLAGFLLAQAMRRTGFDRLIALAILRRASSKPAILMLTMMALTAFLSMWMSNTASVAIIIPIALAVIEKIPSAAGKTGFRRALILGVAYAGAIGGVGSAIGTPANILAMTFLSEYSGTELRFVDWFAYGVPLVLIMLPIIWVFLLISFRVRSAEVDNYISPDVYAEEWKSMGGMTRQQRIVMLVFIGTMMLWLTEGYHHISSGIVALIGALALFFAGILETEDLNRINWNALLTFGGGLAIGTILLESGFSDWIALQLIGLVTLPRILVILLITGMTLLIGAFISNTACAAMLIPLSIPLAQLLQIDPRLMVAIVAISSSIDFALVIGTPPTMLAYATGYFETSEIFKRGIILDIIGALLLSLGVVWIWDLLGVVTF